MSTSIPAEIPTTGTFAIDSVHSIATFSVTHSKVATFRGHFHQVTGELKDGVLSGSVKVDNIDLGLIPAFKEHLLSADWFDAANYPEITFTSTDLHAHGDHLHAAGEITIKGVTAPVEIGGSVAGPVEVTAADGTTADRLGINLVASVDRNLHKVGGPGLGDEVTVEVTLELVAQS